MARLNLTIESDDDLPDISTLLLPRSTDQPPTSKEPAGRQTSPLKKPPLNDLRTDLFTENIPIESVRLRDINPVQGGDTYPINQPQPLTPSKPTRLNSRNPLIKHDTDVTTANVTKSHTTENESRRSSPRKATRPLVDYSKFAYRFGNSDRPSSSSGESEDSFTDLSGFIVPDSASDEELLLPARARRKGGLEVGDGVVGKGRERRGVRRVRRSSLDGEEETGVVDLTSLKKEVRTTGIVCPESPPRFKTPPQKSDGVGSGLDEPLSRLRFSPPRSQSPHKIKDGPRPVTPPLSPSKPRLQSPSKRDRVPPSPHRPSIDAFWSADVINDWNEQYSPKKILKSPRKFRLEAVDEDDSDISPSESPRRSQQKCPLKRDKGMIARRKAFDEKKHQLATSFLAEVDLVVGQGQVSALAESTGGIKVIWSKKLSSTAGRANWRREALRAKNVSGSLPTTTYLHHASIELAEKVIDDEDRLSNVIAHEYCHLANFMISGIKDNPHGSSFKTWAANCTRAFKHRNINVTTKHTYEIAYKYIWVCTSESCAVEYKRHSKSINPAKHSCGSCKGKLVQVQPVPRKGDGEGKKTEYQEFVKREHERVRMGNPGKGFGEIMVILGREFRESKDQTGAVVQDEGGNKKPLTEQKEECNALDDVAQRLGFLDLKA